MGIQELQDLGWGVPVPMAVPPPPAQVPAAPPQPQAQSYVPIGTPAFTKGGYGPGTTPGNSQADADAALQAALTDGGPVKPKEGTPAGGPALLPPSVAGAGTKAGMRPSTESVEVKSGVPVTPELAASEQAVRDTGAAVNRAGADVETLRPLEDQAKAQEQAIYDQKLADAAANRQKDYINELSNEKWKRDKAQAAFEMAASKGIDPDRYWKEKSAGGTIATALSLMAGGFVSGMNGGPNQALEMVNKAIDRDISAQRDNLSTLKGRADDADTHLGLFVKEGMDKDQAQAAATVLARQNFAKQLEAKYTATSNAVGKLTLAKASQVNAQEMAKSEQEYQKLTADSVTKKVDEKYQAATTGGGAPTRAAVEALGEKLLLGGKYASPDEAIRAAGHMLGYDPAGAPAVAAATAKGAGKVSPRIQTRLADLDAQDKAATQLEGLLKGGSSLSPSDRATATALAAQLRQVNPSVPENPLQTWDSTTARAAGIKVVHDQIKDKRKALEDRAASGGGGGSETDEKSDD